MSKEEDKHKPDDSAKPKGDIHGVIHDGTNPPKKVSLFLSKKIWIAAISFIVLAAIGGIIEFTVQRPIEKFINGVRGPKLSSLEKNMQKGNFRYVYDHIRDKFKNDPGNKKIEDLYLRSTAGLMKKMFLQNEMDDAFDLLINVTENAPVTDEFKTSLRIIYLSHQPEVFAVFIKTEKSPDASKRLNDLWEKAEKVAALEQDRNAEILFYAGKTLAEFDWVGDRYNIYSLDYFEKGLEIDPSAVESDFVIKIIYQALSDYPERDIVQKARKLLFDFYFQENIEKLKRNLRPYVFEQAESEEPRERLNLRKNSYIILKDAGKLDEADEFNYNLMFVSHFFFPNDEDKNEFKNVKAYFEKLKKSGRYKDFLKQEDVPPNFTATIFYRSPDSTEYKLAWPLVSGILAPLYMNFCRENAESPYHPLSDNCKKLIK